jgi:hypothetical protein
MREEMASNGQGGAQSGRRRYSKSGKGLRFSITGAALLVSAALLTSAHVMSTGSDTPWWVAVVALAGAAYLFAGLRRA